ncbi:hypothetical protein ASG36_17485 [Geodermatophilus sp. Leaf369]|uniref:hypothetical protein n=1 Tax=Geodermatophilus sp. Leaf369 TaxID=1736354 RepID=UPI0006FE32C7|nr:hypothetical protein [Geodermatophilus sp. Leaf369]KQS56820.1 hypothetical protein ASG36_17485 [Geodermatophilus sp. Leaf369]
MSWRDGDTAEFPAVPAGREPTHVVGPWALGTRGTDDDWEYWRDAGPDRDPVREPAAPSGRRRRLLVGSAIGAAALALVVGVAVGAGAAISPDVSSADPTVSVSTSSPSETAPTESDPTETDPAPGDSADDPAAADEERPGPGGPADPADGPEGGPPAGGPAGGPAGPGG